MPRQQVSWGCLLPPAPLGVRREGVGALDRTLVAGLAVEEKERFGVSDEGGRWVRYRREVEPGDLLDADMELVRAGQQLQLEYATASVPLQNRARRSVKENVMGPVEVQGSARKMDRDNQSH